MFFAVHAVLKRMHELDDTAGWYVPKVTGPGALKHAFAMFMGMTSENVDEICASYCKPPAWHYVGVVDANRSVDVLGGFRISNDWVIRTAVNGQAKLQGFEKMDIAQYGAVNKVPTGRSCLMHLYDRHQQLSDREIVDQVRQRRW